MSSIQAYKVHKQEGTTAATTLVYKQGTQTRGIFEFPSIPTSVMAALHVKQPRIFFLFVVTMN